MKNEEKEYLLEFANGKEVEGCILLDPLAFFPYSNQEILSFDVKLVEDIYDSVLTDGFMSIPWDRGEKKINHRAPNKGWVTISSKSKKKVCKYGCPVWGTIDELNKNKYLVVKLGIKEKCIFLYFPVKFELTSQKPFSLVQIQVHGRDKDIFEDTQIEIIGYSGNAVGYRSRELPAPSSTEDEVVAVYDESLLSFDSDSWEKGMAFSW